MKIEVRDITGHSYPLEFAESEVPLSAVMQLLSENYQLRPEKLCFCAEGVELPGNATLKKDGSVLVMVDSGVFSEKSFPAVDDAFAFGSMFRYADHYVDMEAHLNDENRVMQQFNISGKSKNRGIQMGRFGGQNTFRISSNNINDLIERIQGNRNHRMEVIEEIRNAHPGQHHALMNLIGLMSSFSRNRGNTNNNDDFDYPDIEEDIDEYLYNDSDNDNNEEEIEMNIQEFDDYDDDELDEEIEEANENFINQSQMHQNRFQLPFFVNEINMNNFGNNPEAPQLPFVPDNNRIVFNIDNHGLGIIQNNPNVFQEQNHGVNQAQDNIRPDNFGNMFFRFGNDQLPPPQMNLTPEEEAAVRRLMSHGYSMRNVLEIYDACDHDEMAALNLLAQQN